jgi:BlaI family transcriptional regulator, penicillinase repressor
MDFKNRKPTESELEILQVLWHKGTASVREVHEQLMDKKEVGYTTTLKLMQIMLDKGLVKRDDNNRAHIYKAAVNKESTQLQLLTKMIANLFGGSSTQLVMQALGSQMVSDEDLEQIQLLINNLKNKE